MHRVVAGHRRVQQERAQIIERALKHRGIEACAAKALLFARIQHLLRLFTRISLSTYLEASVNQPVLFSLPRPLELDLRVPNS